MVDYDSKGVKQSLVRIYGLNANAMAITQTRSFTALKQCLVISCNKENTRESCVQVDLTSIVNGFKCATAFLGHHFYRR